MAGFGKHRIWRIHRKDRYSIYPRYKLTCLDLIVFLFQWAYGITCWEIFTCGKIPYSGYNFNAMLSLLRTGKRMEKPDNQACNDEM